MPAEVAAALRRPLTRWLLVLAGAAGAWAAVGQGATTRVGGALGGWQTATAATSEVVLVLGAVAAAVSGSARRAHHLDDIQHAAGVGPRRRQRTLVAVGMILGTGPLLAFSLGAAAAGLARAVLEGTSWWATAGYATGSSTEIAGFAVRLGLGCALLGAGAALAGHLTSREALAGVVAAAASVPFLTVAGGIAGRSSGLLAVLAFTPVGAVRATLLGQQGLAVPGLETPAAVWPQAGAAGAWLTGAAVLDHRRTTGRRWGRVRSSVPVGAPHRRPAARVLAGSAVVLATLVAAATLPEQVGDQLPWRWQPEWRAATRAGRASHQVVGEAVADVRAGRPPPPGVPDGVAQALRRGSEVTVAPVRGLRGPDEVPVLITFDEPIASGAYELDAVLVRFLCVPVEGGWAIEAADGPFAAGGSRRADDGMER